jgi:hypothetical protein
MMEQLALDGAPAKPLTDRQQLAFDYVRERNGVTADEVGAYLHSCKERRPHSIDDRCDYCARDGRGVLISKAVAPLVTYRRDPGGSLYVARNPADVIREPAPPMREPTEAELAANPFCGL